MSRRAAGSARSPAKNVVSHAKLCLRVTRRGKKRLCNVSAALEGAFSSLNQITKVTPSAYPARGLHTVVRATKWDVGLRDVCVNKVFRLQLRDVFGIQGCWRPGISFLGGILIQIQLFILFKQLQGN